MKRKMNFSINNPPCFFSAKGAFFTMMKDLLEGDSNYMDSRLEVRKKKLRCQRKGEEVKPKERTIRALRTGLKGTLF